jgi:DNA-binding NarL/FixJ family response regulator
MAVYALTSVSFARTIEELGETRISKGRGASNVIEVTPVSVMPSVKARILLADDHGLMLEGLQRILEPEYEIVGAVTDGRALLETAPLVKPDVILIDISMPLMNGIEAAARLSKEPHHALIIIVSMHSDPDYVRAALDSGASGYVLKRSAGDELKIAIAAVLSGKTYISPSITTAGSGSPSLNLAAIRTELTPRQREVLQLIAEGRIAKEIAAVLNISVKTVEFHKTSISQALGLRTTAELTRYALERGIVGTGIGSKRQ